MHVGVAQKHVATGGTEEEALKGGHVVAVDDARREAEPRHRRPRLLRTRMQSLKRQSKASCGAYELLLGWHKNRRSVLHEALQQQQWAAARSQRRSEHNCEPHDRMISAHMRAHARTQQQSARTGALSSSGVSAADSEPAERPLALARASSKNAPACSSTSCSSTSSASLLRSRSLFSLITKRSFSSSSSLPCVWVCLV